jgi:Trk-type K+ transport system membrane component
MFESKGSKRTVASVFAVLACVSQFIPVLQPFQHILIEVAGAFGVVGLGHAAVASRKL